MSLSPPSTVPSPCTFTPASADAPADLDTVDELAIRSLLLGVTHRTAGHFEASYALLVDASKRQSEIKVSTWVGGIACFELAVLILKRAESKERVGTPPSKEEWAKALDEAKLKLDQASSLSGTSTDLSSRLGSRILMLKEQIVTKEEMLGL